MEQLVTEFLAIALLGIVLVPIFKIIEKIKSFFEEDKK